MADLPTTRCQCASCRMRGIMGPVMLITLGAIFLSGEYTRYDFGYLWPLLLIVPGIVMVAQALVSKEGHVDR